MSHCRKERGSLPATGREPWDRRAEALPRTAPIPLWTASAAPTASMPASPRSAGAKEALAERAKTMPTAL